MPSSELVIFNDNAKQERIGIIDFGRMFVGTQKETIVYLANISNDWPIRNIRVNEANKEIDIEYPKELKPRESVAIKIKWSPGIAQRKPLDSKYLFEGELWIG
jgi:hypothetical protein